MLDGSSSVGEGHRWRVYGLAEKQWVLTESGKRLVLAAKGTALIRVTLTVGALVDPGEGGDQKGIVLADAEVEIAVSGGGGGGDVKPDPKPDSDKFGVVEFVGSNAKLVTAEKQLAAMLAGNYRRVGELAKAGKIDVKSNAGKVDVGATINAMSVAVGAANATLPEAGRPAWRPILLKVNGFIEELANKTNSPIKTSEDAGQLFVDVAVGLEKIK